MADQRSRDIFFVAGARSLGHAAWYDEVNLHSVPALVSEQQMGKTGMLYLKPATKSDELTSYYSHFSLSKIENGRPRLLEFPEDASFLNRFADGEELEQGLYQLTTGTRLANGTVLARTEIFQLGDSATVTLALRHDTEQLQVIGNLNAEDIYINRDGRQQSILSTTGRCYYILGLTQDNHEPSNHALHDIALKRSELDALGYPMLLLDAAQNQTIVEEITESLHMDSRNLPLFVIADTFNRIVWVRQGYTIGLGEQLLKALGKLK